jgi:pyridoxal phosphate enzyme (YggS family)
MAAIQENVASVRARMEAAAREAGRDPAEILLCAATKTNDADAVKAAVAAGVDCCGENRVQELTAKQPLGAYEGRPVHFIGRLQTNKVKFVVGAVALIQSVDRDELLACIQKEAAKKGVVQDVLLEVNIGAEESKAGYSPDAARRAAANMASFPAVRLRGLMAIPPVSEFPGENRRYFAEMRNLFVDIKEKKYDNVSMECLSMGMSEDFEDAIREGSTMVRVGTAIFGPRHYPTK